MEIEIVNLFSQFGFAGIFLFLYIQERRRSAAIRDEHIRDLRYIAGLRNKPADVWNDVPDSASMPVDESGEQ